MTKNLDKKETETVTKFKMLVPESLLMLPQEFLALLSCCFSGNYQVLSTTMLQSVSHHSTLWQIQYMFGWGWVLESLAWEKVENHSVYNRFFQLGKLRSNLAKKKKKNTRNGIAVKKIFMFHATCINSL